MGKATRWIRGLLGMKKEKENASEHSGFRERKNRNRWSFTKSGKDSAGLREIPAVDTAWLRSLIVESDKERNKHAIAVAAATAAAAEAAVAAAQAAAAVVKLTSHGRGGRFSGGRERLAAVKIQTCFRGFLARKALRALRGIVKLQALVRGYLVRKRAAATLHSMEALIRAQALVQCLSNEFMFEPETRRCRRSEYNDDRYYLQDFAWGFIPEECKFTTPQNTPPAKSVCGCPNYMANTQSFKGKLRSQSAPKQRPGPIQRFSLNEMMMASRTSFSAVGMDRSCINVEEHLGF